VAHLDYHRRYRQDGSCQVICTSCFATLGIAFNTLQARVIEEEHLCPVRIHGETQAQLSLCRSSAKTGALATDDLIQRFLAASPRHRMYQPLAVLSAVAFLYALPTAFELLASQYLTVWLACIVPGNLAGCICIGAIFKRPRMAVLLYFTLAVLESYLLLFHLLPNTAFVWLVDVVPTLTVAALVIHTCRTAEVHDPVVS
jgi:hypothetical protein